MSARFEIVRTDAKPQPWHARLVIGGRITWRTENYARMVGAERAVISFANVGTDRGVRWGLKWNVEGIEKVFVRDDGTIPPHAPVVKYIDERTPPAAPLVPEPPFYLGFPIQGDPFWHDREYHWRFCYGDECTEGAPEFGTKIRVRFGYATHERGQS